MRGALRVTLDLIGNGFSLERTGALTLCFYYHQGEVVGELTFTEEVL